MSTAIPADLAEALEVARAATMWSAFAIRLLEGETSEQTATAFAGIIENLDELGERKGAITRVRMDLVNASEPSARFGASCAHVAALNLRARVLAHVRHLVREADPVHFTPVDFVPHSVAVAFVERGEVPVTNWPVGSAIAAACEIETCKATAARKATQPETVSLDDYRNEGRAEGELLSAEACGRLLGLTGKELSTHAEAKRTNRQHPNNLKAKIYLWRVVRDMAEVKNRKADERATRLPRKRRK